MAGVTEKEGVNGMSLFMHNLSYSVKKGASTTQILSDFNLQAREGEFLSLIGKSGTGKSTVLKLAAGLLQPDQGEVLIKGFPVHAGSAGYMPQKDLLLPWRSVLNNLLLAPEIQQLKKEKVEEAERWLERVGLYRWKNALPHELSGGMRQRVAFLRTILTGKDVLLLDEPFAALDAFTKKEMHSWISSLWKEMNKTILLVTHDLQEAVFLSDRVIMLHDSGRTEEMKINLTRPRETVMTHEMADVINTLESRITYEKI